MYEYGLSVDLSQRRIARMRGEVLMIEFAAVKTRFCLNLVVESDAHEGGESGDTKLTANQRGN